MTDVYVAMTLESEDDPNTGTLVGVFSDRKAAERAVIERLIKDSDKPEGEVDVVFEDELITVEWKIDEDPNGLYGNCGIVKLTTII